MSIRARIDLSNWLELPSGFPTETDADSVAWIERVVGEMRAGWPADSFDAAMERAVRDELRSGLDAARPEDSVTLQYWAWFRPIAAVVHVVFSGFGADDERPSYLLGDGPLAAAPAFEVVTATHLGEGVEVRVLVRPEGFADDLAGLTQLYVSGDRFVGVGVDATVPALLTVMLPDLRDLLDTVEIVDDDGEGPWLRAEVAADALPAEGEGWPFEVRADVTA